MAYTLEGRNGGTVRFEPFETGIVESESESYSSSVTSNPVENGADMNDHVNNAAGTLSISGVIIGGDTAIQALKDMRDSRDILTYTGVTRMTNLVFTSLRFQRTHKNRDGASFSATLQQVKINTTEYTPANGQTPMIRQDVGKSSNKQLAQTGNAGMQTVSVQAVSAVSSQRLTAAYTQISSAAPLTRQTGSYDGLAF